ncbi:minor tail protein [Mycobacterium Phage Nergal]|nr:minor tail protein [Mycobacterium Phage Nergal]
MPRGLDPIGAQLPISHNPLNRIVHTTPQNDFDILKAVEDWGKGFQQFGIEAIKKITGLDLTSPQTLVESIIELIAGGINALQPLAELIGVSADALGDFFNNLLNKNSPLNAGNIIGHIVDDIVPGIGETIDKFWKALTGQTTTGVSKDDAASQLAELAATTAANAAAIADLQADEDGSTNSGVSGNDDFERENPTGVGPGWNETYSGNPSTSGQYILDGHQAVWIDDGNNENAARFRRTDPADAVTKTDFQKVGLVIGTIVGEGPQVGSTSTDRIYGRMNAAETQYVYAEMYTDSDIFGAHPKVRLIYANNGPEVTAKTADAPGRSVGATYVLVCGTSAVGGLRRYQVLRNGSAILTWDDTNSATAVGPDNRGWGWGGRSGTRIAGQATPSAVTRVTIADNAPVPVLGTTFRVSRTLTSAVTKPEGLTLLPANTFNTIDYITPDLLWNPSLNTITVAKAGTYLFSTRYHLNADVSANEDWSVLLYKNAVLHTRGETVAGVNPGVFGQGVSDSNNVVGGGGLLVYLNAGESISFGMGSGSTEGIIGDAGGTLTWATGVRIG